MNILNIRNVHLFKNLMDLSSWAFYTAANLHIYTLLPITTINLFNPYLLPYDIDITLYVTHRREKTELRKAIFT